MDENLSYIVSQPVRKSASRSASQPECQPTRHSICAPVSQNLVNHLSIQGVKIFHPVIHHPPQSCSQPVTLIFIQLTHLAIHTSESSSQEASERVSHLATQPPSNQPVRRSECEEETRFPRLPQKQRLPNRIDKVALHSAQRDDIFGVA